MAKEKMQVRVMKGIQALLNIVEMGDHTVLMERSKDKTVDLRYIILEPMLIIRLKAWIEVASVPRTCMQVNYCPFLKKCSTTCFRIFPRLLAICPCTVYDIEDILDVAKKVVRFNNSIYRMNSSIYKLRPFNFLKNFKGG